MRLSDLTKNVAGMTDEELKEHVRQMRHNKYVAKPAVAKRKADVVKKEHNAGVRSLSKQLELLSDEEKLKLLQQLEGDDSNG